MSRPETRDGLQPEEAEFVAAEYLVKVLPKFSHGPLHCVTGDFGPFMTGVPAEVPLWIALKLREDSLCQVLAPSWMSVETLAEILTREKDYPNILSKIPFYFTEIAWLLLSGWSREDIPNAEKVGELVQDIEAVRKAKLQRGMNAVFQISAKLDVPTVVDLSGITSCEVSSLRSTFFRAMDGIVEAGQMQIELDRARRTRGATRGRVADPSNYSAYASSYTDDARTSHRDMSDIGSLFGRDGTASGGIDPTAVDNTTTFTGGQSPDRSDLHADRSDLHAGAGLDATEADALRRGENADGTVKLRRFK